MLRFGTVFLFQIGVLLRVFATGFRLFSDAEISVIFCRLFSLTMHGCCGGHGCLLRGGRWRARQLDAAGCSKARYALDNKYRQLYLSLW